MRFTRVVGSDFGTRREIYPKITITVKSYVATRILVDARESHSSTTRKDFSLGKKTMYF